MRENLFQTHGFSGPFSNRLKTVETRRRSRGAGIRDVAPDVATYGRTAVLEIKFKFKQIEQLCLVFRENELRR